MKALISQPMKDLTQEEIRSNREYTVTKLKTLGYEILDSVFNFEDVEGVKNKPLFYLAKSLQLIASDTDVVYFMRGWENARGCKMEHEACTAYGVKTMYESC